MSVDSEQRVDDWKHFVHLVDRAGLSADVLAGLSLQLGADAIGPTTPLTRAFLAGVRWIAISDSMRRALLDANIRIWTVGYMRSTDVLLVGATGAAQPTRVFHQCVYGLGSPRDAIARVLPVMSDGRLEEGDVLLAEALAREETAALGLRPIDATEVAERDALRAEAIAGGWTDWVDFSDTADHWAQAFEARLREVLAPIVGSETQRIAAAMASIDGPERVEIVGHGVFHRQIAAPVRCADERATAGFLGSFPEFADAPRFAPFQLGPIARYVTR